MTNLFQDEFFYGYKQANRREDDIAIVNAGIQVQFEPNSNVIKGMRLAFGGMAPITVMATTAMKSCVGRYVQWKWVSENQDGVYVIFNHPLNLIEVHAYMHVHVQLLKLKKKCLNNY